jgi:cell division protein ZapA
MGEKVQVTVTVLDGSYTLRGDENSAHIMQVAAMVDEKMRSIQAQNLYLSSLQVAVMGALTVADQYLKLKKDYEDLLDLLAGGEPGEQKLF